MLTRAARVIEHLRTCRAPGIRRRKELAYEALPEYNVRAVRTADRLTGIIF